MLLSGYSPRQVVVIDDEISIVDFIDQGLSACGYQVIGFSDPEDALLMLDISAPPDIFVVDINMPRVSGLDFFEHCRQHPHLRAIPLILMSGLNPQQMRRESMRIGVDDFLDKPFSIQELDCTIEARLKRFQELRMEQAEIKTHITIRTLGTACARKNGQPVNHLPLRALEMLCLLLEHPKGMRIFELGEAMWSGLNERRASNNFHATLHRFRQAFGKDVIEKVNGLYQLSKHVNVSYDAQLLCQLDPDNSAHHSRALELYQGDFLSDSQSLWVLQRREELARHFKQFEQPSYAMAH